MTPDGELSRDFIQRYTDQAGYHVMPEFVQATAAEYESWPALVKALPFTDPEVLATFIDGIPKVLEWLRPHGIRTHPSMYPLPPALQSRLPCIYGGGLAIIEALCPELERLGARIEYETTAVKLLTDDDERVVGIKATDRNHAGVRIEARAVVLACGGFEGNPEMTVRYMGPEARYLRPPARGGWYNRGEGIRMALEVNAAPAGDYAECHRQPIDPRSNRAESLVHAYPLGILVNAQGQRFIDEAPDHRDGYLEEPLRALSRQPSGIAYFIFDRQIEHTSDWRIMVRSDQPAIEAPSLRELAPQDRNIARCARSDDHRLQSRVSIGPLGHKQVRPPAHQRTPARKIQLGVANRRAAVRLLSDHRVQHLYFRRVESVPESRSHKRERGCDSRPVCSR